MIEAHERPMQDGVSRPGAWARRFVLPSTDRMLITGGDARLALDPATGRNRYGCSPAPERDVADFGSSTASTISARGFHAAGALRERLLDVSGQEAPGATYARELDRQRGRLTALCGLSPAAGVEVVFAASGTDLHLLVAQLMGGAPATPLICVTIEPEETGGGVYQALGGRHFSNRAALGALVSPGALIGLNGADVLALRGRGPDGMPRSDAEVEADLDLVARAAAKAGRKMLLTVTDVSKTGLISPNLAAVLDLRGRYPGAVEVLIDACQFRLAPATVRAYLDHGFLVAVTGSKFVTGPAYSGALLIPRDLAPRLRDRLMRPELGAYGARGDWPSGWAARAAMPPAANFGLLLRWEAALEDLTAFRALPEAEVEIFMRDFAQAVTRRLADDPWLEALDGRAMDREAIGVSGGWDAVATVFPFLIRHSPGSRPGYLSLAATQGIHRSLMEDRDNAARSPARLGQPVMCGERHGRPIGALRLCNSARLAIEGVGGDRNARTVIAQAMTTLDRVVGAARALAATGQG